jgi:geranylgeranyl pyrophosphate synthase
MWKSQSKLRKIFAAASYIDPFELVRDDTNGISSSIRDVIGSDHPIMRTVAGYFFESNTNRTRPALLFLLSRAISNTSMTAVAAASGSVAPPATASAVLDRQRMLAEITELIHVANILHVNVPDTEPVDQSRVAHPVPPNRSVSGRTQSLTTLATTALEHTTGLPPPQPAVVAKPGATADAAATPVAATTGAPVAATEVPAASASAAAAAAVRTFQVAQSFTGKKLVLGGDLLFSRAVVGLHQLHSHGVTGLVARAIEHAAEGEVMEAKDTHENVHWWETKAFFRSASLMAHTSQATAVLASGTDNMERAAFDLGKFLGLTAQAMDDVRAYNSALPRHLQTGEDVTEPAYEVFEAAAGGVAGPGSVSGGSTPGRRRGLLSRLAGVLPMPLRRALASQLAPKVSVEQILAETEAEGEGHRAPVSAGAAAATAAVRAMEWPLTALARVPASSTPISPSSVVSTATSLLYAATPAPLPDTAGLVYVLAVALDPSVAALARAAEDDPGSVAKVSALYERMQACGAQDAARQAAAVYAGNAVAAATALSPSQWRDGLIRLVYYVLTRKH